MRYILLYTICCFLTSLDHDCSFSLYRPSSLSFFFSLIFNRPLFVRSITRFGSRFLFLFFHRILFFYRILSCPFYLYFHSLSLSLPLLFFSYYRAFSFNRPHIFFLLPSSSSFFFLYIIYISLQLIATIRFVTPRIFDHEVAFYDRSFFFF